MPSPNVCVIGEPTPANIAAVPPTVFQIAPGRRIDARLRVDECGVAASLSGSSRRASATSAKTGFMSKRTCYPVVEIDGSMLREARLSRVSSRSRRASCLS